MIHLDLDWSRLSSPGYHVRLLHRNGIDHAGRVPRQDLLPGALLADAHCPRHRGAAGVVLVQVFSKEVPRTLVDVETREQVVLHPPQGTFFFVPMRYCVPILFVCAAATAIYQIAHGKDMSRE